MAPWSRSEYTWKEGLADGLDEMYWRKRGVRISLWVLICAAVKMELSSTNMIRAVGRKSFGGKNKNFEKSRI